MEMQSDVSSSFMYTSKRPLVVLTAGCRTECISPIAVMVQFNQRVTGLKASMFATTGRVLSLVHLEPGTKDHADRFILYLEKASHSVDVSLSGYLVTGDEGLYNTPSNTLVIGFRDEHSAVVALSSHFTRSNPFDFILSFEGYTVVKEGAEGISCTGCSVVGVMVTRGTLLRGAEDGRGGRQHGPREEWLLHRPRRRGERGVRLGLPLRWARAAALTPRHHAAAGLPPVRERAGARRNHGVFRDAVGGGGALRRGGHHSAG